MVLGVHKFVLFVFCLEEKWGVMLFLNAIVNKSMLLILLMVKTITRLTCLQAFVPETLLIMVKSINEDTLHQTEVLIILRTSHTFDGDGVCPSSLGPSNLCACWLSWKLCIWYLPPFFNILRFVNYMWVIFILECFKTYLNQICHSQVLSSYCCLCLFVIAPILALSIPFLFLKPAASSLPHFAIKFW